MAQSCALILAAGDGKRMKSKHPKVLCQVLFRPMISWVTDACLRAGVQDICAVLGAGAEEVAPVLPQGCKTALQLQRLGTGHAVMCAREFLEEHRGGDILILCGDAPFVSAGLIEDSYRYHCEKGNEGFETFASRTLTTMRLSTWSVFCDSLLRPPIIMSM